jgi:hypothetical protein
VVNHRWKKWNEFRVLRRLKVKQVEFELVLGHLGQLVQLVVNSVAHAHRMASAPIDIPRGASPKSLRTEAESGLFAHSAKG